MMNYTISLEQLAETGNLNADLITRQHKLDKIAKFMEIKSINPKLKQSEKTRKLKKKSSHYNAVEEKLLCFHPKEYLHGTLTQKTKDFKPHRA